MFNQHNARSFPCCLPLPVERWSELLHFANATGIKVGFNLNLLHGRWPQYTAAVRRTSKVPTPAELAPWDSSNARALLEWTVANMPEELWPAAFGLGNELAWFISPGTWAHDVETLAKMLEEIFPAGKVPQVRSTRAHVCLALDPRRRSRTHTRTSTNTQRGLKAHTSHAHTQKT
jgi:hypothetical protein